MSNVFLAGGVKNNFGIAAALPVVKEEATPFSIRLTKSEKARLRQQAGNRSIGVYIRDQLLGNQANPRRQLRHPKTDEKQVAALLAGLGQSRIPSNLNQLAKAANCGTLGISEEIERDLQDACQAVIAMREALFIALGLRSGGET